MNIPQVPFQPKARVLGLQEGLQQVTDWASDALSSIVGFLRAEHPRGPTPRGPVAESATFQAVCPVIKWRNEASQATVDFFAIYRADAGTAGAPTTPLFTTSKRVAVVPSGRVPRQVPLDSCFTWADLDFSAAEAVANNRFSYWVTAIDNQYRESTPIPIGIVQV
jgi:hypothetical protein